MTSPMIVPGMLPPLATINTSTHTPSFPGTGRSPLSSPITTAAQDRLSPSLAIPSSGMFGGEIIQQRDIGTNVIRYKITFDTYSNEVM